MIVVALLIVAVVGLYAVESGALSMKGSTPLASVTVLGSAVTATSDNPPAYLLFISDGGQVYNATISSNHYSVVLPTNHTYSVRLVYLGSQSIARGSKGECAVGTITVPSNSASAQVTKDWSC